MESKGYSFRVVWNEEDEIYIATSPEFEGVSGFGQTPGEALEEAETSLRLVMESHQKEGWPMPAPEHACAYSGQFRIRMPRNLHARLAQSAADQGVSLNSYATHLLSSGQGQTQALEEMRSLLQGLLVQGQQTWLGDNPATSFPGASRDLQSTHAWN